MNCSTTITPEPVVKAIIVWALSGPMNSRMTTDNVVTKTVCRNCNTGGIVWHVAPSCWNQSILISRRCSTGGVIGFWAWRDNQLGWPLLVFHSHLWTRKSPWFRLEEGQPSTLIFFCPDIDFIQNQEICKINSFGRSALGPKPTLFVTPEKLRVKVSILGEKPQVNCFSHFVISFC